MHRIRGKLTFSNVVASIALFIALAGGTAYAASQLDKESVGTRQLKKEAVTPNKLSKSAKQTLTGAAGPTGPAGASGAQGPKGDRGEPGPFLERLPSGKTETGIWGFAGRRANYFPGTQVSFTFPLASDPIVTIRPTGSSPTPECPGSAQAPAAARGHLCIYEETSTPIDTINAGPGYRAGFIYLIHAAEDTETEVYGSWAVTAP
jgi:hypothetical protein